MESTVDIAAHDTLKAENGILLQRADAAEKQANHYRKKLVTTEEQLAQLAYELVQLKRLVFGVKSERFVPGFERVQLPLFDGVPAQDEVPATETITYTKRKKRKPVRQALPSHLPREVIVIEPDVDTSSLKKIGEEVTETLDYRAAKLVVIRRERPKYVDPSDEARGVIIGELPARPVEKGIAEPSLLSHVVIEKYVDHLPLYRQVQRFTREGCQLAPSTLGDWISASADLLEPLYCIRPVKYILPVSSGNPKLWIKKIHDQNKKECRRDVSAGGIVHRGRTDSTGLQRRARHVSACVPLLAGQVPTRNGRAEGFFGDPSSSGRAPAP